MVRDNRHISTYIFGAICPDRAVGAALIIPPTASPTGNCRWSLKLSSPYANTEAMNRHLEEISQTVSPGAHALLVCDGASWHQRGQNLSVPNNITLLSLPAYSPELNPMENVWAYLRQNKLCALVWETYDDILDACQSALQFLVNDPDRIRSIGTRKWEAVSN
jgi:transposase